MGQGYTRNDASNNIANGNVINAADLDGEFDAIVNAFASGTGHTHDGTAAEGGAITVVGPAQEYIGDGIALYPKLDAIYDLGKAASSFNVAYIESLNLGGTVVTATAVELNYTDGVTSAIQTQLDNKQPLDAGLTSISGLVTAADSMIYTTGLDTYATTPLTAAGRALIDDASASAQRTTLGLGSIATQASSSVSITGGTIDGTVIGGTTPAAGSFTTGSFTGNVSFGDNDKAIFGAGSDLQIYHDGSNSYVHDAGVGSLILRATNFRLFNAGETKVSILANDGGETSLYHDGSKKIATTSTGIDVTGTVTADGLTVDGGAEVRNHDQTSLNIVSTDTSIIDAQVYGNLNFISEDGSLVGGRKVVAGLEAVNRGGAGSYAAMDFYTSAGTGVATTLPRLRIDYNGDISFYEDTGTTPKFFWDASAESLGIGTTSPSGKLHVVGGTTGGTSFDTVALVGGVQGVTGSGAKLYLSGADTAPTSRAVFIEGVNTGGSTNAHDMIFATSAGSSAPAERMRIDSSGNLLVGTTNVDAGISDTTGTEGQLSYRPTQGWRQKNNVNFYNRTSAGDFYRFRYQGTQVGSIAVGTVATAYNTSSDYRLKEDVQPMTGASARVQSLKPCNFAWKADGSRTDGFLAHEAQAVVPEAVTGEKDGEEMQAIDQSKLVPLLTAALQEALTKIDALETRITALEG